MTVMELRRLFNNEYGINKPWPEYYEVDAETYANLCHYILSYAAHHHGETKGRLTRINLLIGPENGIIYKNVELRLKSASN